MFFIADYQSRCKYLHRVCSMNRHCIEFDIVLTRDAKCFSSRTINLDANICIDFVCLYISKLDTNLPRCKMFFIADYQTRCKYYSFLHRVCQLIMVHQSRCIYFASSLPTNCIEFVFYNLLQSRCNFIASSLLPAILHRVCILIIQPACIDFAD